MVTRAKACLGVAVFVACLSTNVAILAGELVRFESAPVHVGQLQQRLARERGETPKAESETIEGYLSKPEGDGPFSAIAYLHGCDGLSEDARTYNARGYVSLMLDSFATRGIKNACTQVTPGLLLTRQGDALGALSYLSNLPFVDSQRIAVVGYSQGAMVALQLASNHQAEIFDVPRDRKFKAAVAYYPLCGVASEELIVPALIMIGELDDWTPATDCERLGSIGVFGWKPAVNSPPGVPASSSAPAGLIDPPKSPHWRAIVAPVLARIACQGVAIHPQFEKGWGGMMRNFGSGWVRAAGALMALCSASMLPIAARAYTPEQQQACTGDAFRLCSSEIPDVDRVTACMIRNKRQLSPECRAQFGPPSRAAARADNVRPAAKHKAVSAKTRKSKKPAKREA